MLLYCKVIVMPNYTCHRNSHIRFPRMKRGIIHTLAVIAFAALFSLSPLNAKAFSQDKHYYTLQLATFSREANSKRYFEALREKISPDLHSHLRVERIDGLFAIRLGACEGQPCIQSIQELVRGEFPKTRLLKARILPERIVLGTVVTVAASSPDIPAKAPSRSTSKAEADPVQAQPPKPTPKASMPKPRPKQASAPQAQASPSPSVPTDAPAPTGWETLLSTPVVRYAAYILPVLFVLAAYTSLRKKRIAARAAQTGTSSAAPPAAPREESSMTTSTAFNGDGQDDTLRDVPSLSESEEKRLRENLAELAMIQGNIQGKDKNVRNIYITSCFNGEGKTRASLNMAHGMSINHTNVLLIDGNPRAPKLHERYGIPRTPGLMDVLFLDTPLEDAVHKTKYRDLHIMPFGQGPPGRPNPLKNDALQALLHQLKDHYDFVIMDGHSQIGSSDGPLLASVFDGAVLVVECEKTKWEVVQEASKKIALLGGQPLGIVLNKRRFYIPELLYGRKQS